MFRQSVAWVAICVGLQLASVASANPSQKSPSDPLDLHNLTQAQELLTAAKKLWEQCAKTIPNLKQPTYKILSQEHLNLRRLQRLALELQIQGEPAGYDYSLRAKALEAQLRAALDSFKASRAGPAAVTTARQTLAQPRSVQSREQALQRIRQLVQAQKWLEAGALLADTTDNITAVTIFLERPEEQQILDTFQDVWPADGRRKDQLRQQAQEALVRSGGDSWLDMAGVVSETAKAAAALRSTPTVQIDGAALSGPQCLAHFGKLWGQAQLVALRYRATEWARRLGLKEVSTRLPTDPLRVVDADYSKLVNDLIAALAGLIAADAARASDAEAPQLYGEYLRVAAPLVAAAADDKLGLAFSIALEKLAAKSPQLATEVAAYRAATDECLRWRQRAANSAAAARLTQYPPSDQLLRSAVTTKPGFAGLLPGAESSLEQTQLLASCPDVLAGMAPQVIEKKTLLRNVAGLPVAGRGVARYQQRHYANLVLPPAIEELKKLRHDLLVTEQVPPLSLEAAVAIESCQRNNYVAVGAIVKNVYLEGVIPRFATLPEAAAPLVALGPLPTDAGVGIESVLVRFDVTPQWVRHKYFFMDLESSATPAAASATAPGTEPKPGTSN